uniref:Uncharacterized protein n=1 Tax=Siphoviridae sp. ctZd434 TaxID=2825559 RepID=A0A8S5UHN5_9CAUD|nr:MAG TPA: hypothetical protein [Siphoviridae sp. ctZd434]
MRGVFQSSFSVSSKVHDTSTFCFCRSILANSVLGLCYKTINTISTIVKHSAITTIIYFENLSF